MVDLMTSATALVSRVVFVHDVEYDAYKTLTKSQQEFLGASGPLDLPADTTMDMDAILSDMEGS